METRSKNTKFGAINRLGTPFYEPPPRKTSSEIINEAKLAIRGVDPHQVADNTFAQTVIKPLQTQRPFTPREKERILFGKKAKSNRPPSSFSLRYLQSENELSIPSAPSEDGDDISPRKFLNNDVEKCTNVDRQRANSISEINENKIFNVGVKEVGVPKIKLPSLDGGNHKKKFLKNTFSLDYLSEESESPKPPQNRNAFSSPQENTACNAKLRNESPFGRPSKKQTLSECLLLGPQNFNNIFGNRQIIEDSETLFLEGEKAQKQRSVNDVIDILNSDTIKDETVIIELLHNLYDRMEQENLLAAKINSKTKIYILKCLYKFVESQNEELLLALAHIILALKVTGSNLSGVCKLIFKVSKNDKNDHLFQRKNILELFINSIGRCSPLEDAEACVYGYGAIKFLTMNPTLLQKNINLGILPLMILHLKIINNCKIEKNYIPEQTNHTLFQLTGALRNLAGDESIYDLFVDSQGVQQLCLSLNLFSSDIDVITNISRILSTVSTNDRCSDHISEYPDIYKVFVKLFEKYPGNDEIIIRLTYTVGNIVARIDEARVMYYNEDNAVPSLINLWKVYLERTLKCCSMEIDDSGNDYHNNEDVMIKVIRIIANISINADIGMKLNEKYGAKLIDEFLKVLISNPFKKNEELVMSILSTLNNLSFYYTSELDPDVFHIKQVDIMESILEYIIISKKDSVIEAMRILGNLSRSSITRSYIAQKDVMFTLLGILTKDDINLLRTTVGVLVNLMADNSNRISLRNSGGIPKLLHVMKTYGQYDWTLSMLVCQTIWNFCIDVTNLNELISDNEIEQLMALLVDLLDEEKLFGINSTPNSEVILTPDYLQWEEFANVATNLLEKIEQFLDTVEQNKVNVPNTRDSSTNISYLAW